MGWASAAIARVRQGQVVTLRPRGHSMTGKVNDDDLVTVEPLGERELHAVEPLERTPGWEGGEAPETYPSAL
ncbi:MAG TPA: hypothetical protein VIU62_02020 [Chloroflexota bacterium]|jgi:hypothetical protein